MFEASHKPADSGNTLTGFLLAVAFVFIPSALLFLRPLGRLSLAIAIAASALCLAFAWMNRKRSLRSPVTPVVSISESGK
jgi:hypothetical protein